jgi:galactose mutarotase-like enzyme
MAAYAVTDLAVDGFPTVVLTDTVADLHATFAPTLGMIGCSLRHRDAELLGQRRGLAHYAATGSTMGIPLLHPWANRLSGDVYTAAGRRVALDTASPLVHRDGNGLPMHGLLSAYPGWRVVERLAYADGARLTAELDFAADPALLAAFPFPHTLRLDIGLREQTLTVTTELRASGDLAVPVSFGFHPYLQLPGAARAEWRLDAPVRRRAVLDARGLPTGVTVDADLPPGPFGDRAFDDLYPELAQPARFVIAGGGREIGIAYDAGYPCAQIFAPPGDAVICLEPMTAPTNALVSGDGLRFAAPGASYRATFSITVTAASSPA